jgi:hypothetical protein
MPVRSLPKPERRRGKSGELNKTVPLCELCQVNEFSARSKSPKIGYPT